MPVPTFETPVGSTNGINRVFFVSTDYRPGSVRMWLNGLLLRADLDDGWVELGGKKVRMQEAPHSGDVVRVFYIPTL